MLFWPLGPKSLLLWLKVTRNFVIVCSVDRALFFNHFGERARDLSSNVSPGLDFPQATNDQRHIERLCCSCRVGHV